MIPYYIALPAYIPVAMLIMGLRNNALGFSLAYLIGLMFLPSARDIQLAGIPDLTKDNVPALGILIGTILFHPRVFDRFRLTRLDFLFFFAAIFAFGTAYLNDFPVRYGVSQVVEIFISFMLPIALARIHLGTPASLRTFMLTLVCLSCLYVPLSLIEFRLSPQIHTWTYGYFQHVFQQHARGSFWRPIVYFYHALSLGRFYALATFLCLLPLRPDLVKLLGRYGNWVFVIPLLGLCLEVSVSPFIIFFAMCALYYAVLWRWWTVFILPTLGYLWLTFVFAGFEFGYGSTTTIRGLSSERAESFSYRLDAISEYKSVILNHPWFGHGGYNRGRIPGRATDSQMIVRLLQYGLLGTIAYMGWFYVAMGSAARLSARMAGTPLARRAAAFAGFTSIALTFTIVDAAIEHFLMLGLAAAYQIDTWVTANPDAQALPQKVARESRRVRDDSEALPEASP